MENGNATPTQELKVSGERGSFGGILFVHEESLFAKLPDEEQIKRICEEMAISPKFLTDKEFGVSYAAYVSSLGCTGSFGAYEAAVDRLHSSINAIFGVVGDEQNCLHPRTNEYGTVKGVVK